MTYSSAPLSTVKSIVASTWPEFIKEIKVTVAQGKQQPHRLLYQDSFFKCLLVDGKNAGFAEALDNITGEEVEVLKCIDKLLESVNTKWADDAPTTVKSLASTETPSSTVSTVGETRESGVEVALVKSKPVRAKRGSKGGQQ